MNTPRLTSLHARVRAVVTFLSATAGTAVLVGLAGAATAQAPSPHDGAGATGSSVPPLPSGEGRMVVEVMLRGSGEPVAGVDVALYALSPDGTPGLASNTTDVAGRTVFEGIAPDPAITYLAGANYEGIPFGERVAFEPGAGEQTVRVEVVAARVDGPPIGVAESRIQVGWLGRHLLVEVTHLLQNPGDAVRKIPDADRAVHGPLFEATLPAEFVEFAEAAVGFADGLERDGTALRFFGPVYPGQQELRYRFTLAVPFGADGATLPIALPQPMGSGRVTVVTPTSGPSLVSDGVRVEREVELEGVAHDLAELAAIPAGGTLSLEFEVPPSRTDVSAIRVPRADYWLDHDDAVVTVQVQIQLEIPPGPHLQGSAEAPLLHVDLPPGATLQGVSAATQALGVGVGTGGGIDIVGPVPAGASSVEFGYELPAQADGSVALDLRLDLPVEVVNVLIADNGIAVESQLLHRRRPFRQSTRNYLHRRAFQVGAGEAIDVRVEPLDDQAAPRNRSLLAVVALGGGAVWFLVAPLRHRHEDEQVAEEPGPGVWQREMVYEAIRDLDLDLETGKIDAADHAELRSGLRAEAIELVRREREAMTPEPQDDRASAAADEGPASVAIGAFCPNCGGRVEPAWRFCSHCGGGLAPS